MFPFPPSPFSVKLQMDWPGNGISTPPKIPTTLQVKFSGIGFELSNFSWPVTVSPASASQGDSEQSSMMTSFNTTPSTGLTKHENQFHVWYKVFMRLWDLMFWTFFSLRHTQTVKPPNRHLILYFRLNVGTKLDIIHFYNNSLHPWRELEIDLL